MGSTPSFWEQAIPLALIFLVFYALVIRPPRVAENRRYKAVMALKGGEEVVTAGGIIGIVTDVGRDDYEVEIADGLRVRMGQKGIAEVREGGEARPEPNATGRSSDAATSCTLR